MNNYHGTVLWKDWKRILELTSWENIKGEKQVWKKKKSLKIIFKHHFLKFIWTQNVFGFVPATYFNLFFQYTLKEIGNHNFVFATRRWKEQLMSQNLMFFEKMVKFSHGLDVKMLINQFNW